MASRVAGVVSIARKNLFHERGRLAISVAGVGFAIMLIVILAGIYDGFNEAATVYVERSGADVFVAQEGTTDMFHSFSILPLNLSDRIASVPGVASVSPLITRQVEVHKSDGHARASIVGYQDLGGPWRVAEGRSTVGPGEIVVDRVLASKNGLEVGSSLRIGETPFRVVGISEGTNMFVLQYAFVRFEDASGLVLPADMTTFFLVKVSPGLGAREVGDRIASEGPGLVVFTTAEFAESNAKIVSEGFLPILGVLYAIGGLIGVMVIGLTVYTATIERAREYGILKAVGATNGRLFRILLSQALVLAAFGFLAGIAISAATVVIIGNVEPSIPFHFEPALFGWVLAAAVAMGVFASYVPMGRIARIDPATVFRRG